MTIIWLSPKQYPLLNANHKNIEEAITTLNWHYGRGEVEVIDFAWCFFVQRPFGCSPRERVFSLEWKGDRCTVKALGHQRTFKINIPTEEDTSNAAHTENRTLPE